MLTAQPHSEFYCRVDDQPDHLVPEYRLERCFSEDMDGHPLFLNPDCQFARDGEIPQELADKAWLMERFSLQANMVWVRAPETGVLQPFWLGQELAAALVNTMPGDPVRKLNPLWTSVLTAASILAPRDHAFVRRQKWADSIARYATQFEHKGYVPLSGLIHPFHISALRRYYRHLLRTSQLCLGDSQNARRYAVHNESVARFFHHQLTPTVSALAGQPVKPSYVYFASYQEGATLKKHIDREQCEFSITFCLDYTPEPRVETPWPLHLFTPTGTVTVFQSIGDGLLYRGCRLAHGRDRIPEGHTSTSIFFHYVADNFDGPLD